MESFTPKYARQSSNNKVLQNEHFLSKKTLNPHAPTRGELNVTESNLMDIKEFAYPKKSLQAKALEEDYEPASYSRAMQYKLSRSYCIKEGDGSYVRPY
jgi:hypothetical protein